MNKYVENFVFLKKILIIYKITFMSKEKEIFTETTQGGPMKPGESCTSPDKPKTEEKPKTKK